MRALVFSLPLFTNTKVILGFTNKSNSTCNITSIVRLLCQIYANLPRLLVIVYMVSAWLPKKNRRYACTVGLLSLTLSPALACNVCFLISNIFVSTSSLV